MNEKGNDMDNSSIMNKAAWPTSLAVATILGCMALACIFPFAAFATLAALTMKPKNGLALIAAVWATNQAIGFFLLSFPWDAQAVGHGIAILGATLLAFGAAKLVLSKMKGNLAFGTPLAWVGAFAVYQIALRAYASVGGGAENFSAEIISAVALNDVLWLTGLMALRFVLAQFTDEKMAATA